MGAIFSRRIAVVNGLARTAAVLGLAGGIAWSGSALGSELKVPAALAGFASTVPRAVVESFRLPAADLPFSDLIQFYRGKAMFEIDMAGWLRTEKAIELGKRNADGCSVCHRSGGRNAVRQHGEYAPPFAPIVISRPKSAPSISLDGRMLFNRLTWKPVEIEIGDSRYGLIYPLLRSESGVGKFEIRITPSLIGLGLIEEIPDDTILDWYARHGSGRVSFIPQSQNGQRIGRFGFKANHTSIKGFVEAALTDELGIGKAQFLSDAQVDDIAFYAREIGVPSRQTEDPLFDDGFEVFQRFGCGSCHRPRYEILRRHRGKQFPLQIWPFSDFLLHNLDYPDAGPNRDQFWRTAPLWGVGRVRHVLGFGVYMHDGRARSLQEAVLWHGGEAARSRRQFLSASDDDKTALLRFLNSL